ncbi:hypothetical protein RHSIM_Rhsim06G0047600 [Rhododendron simsii]|uniref:Uncharacterized protein n=1 Tax=Rhododendron simsii TaxID=118357 RepID=A0A834GWG2_RHOSS|nr:hypothetical protein RHSIM_Rhsim06G0047600 [Rhododendron simsii]
MSPTHLHLCSFTTPSPLHAATPPPHHHRCYNSAPLPLPLRLHSSASKMPSYSSPTPLLLLRFITSASATCRRCRSTSSTLLHVVATPPHHLHNFTAAPLPPLPLCLSVSKRPPIRTPTSNTPPHTIRWKAFTVRHRRSHPSVTTSGFHITAADDNTAIASPRRRSLTTPLLSTTDATQQQQPTVDQTMLSVGDQKSQTMSRSAGTHRLLQKNTTKHGQNGIFRV